jgi:hypothetical protein
LHSASVVYEVAKDLPIYERNKAWLKSKEIATGNIRKSLESIKEQPTFKPKINN